MPRRDTGDTVAPEKLRRAEAVLEVSPDISDQQMVFIQALSEGATLAQAVLAAWPEKKHWNNNSLTQEGHRLKRTAKVFKALQAYRASTIAEHMPTAAECAERAWRLSLKAEAGGQYTGAVAALKTHGEFSGTLVERKEVDVRVSSDAGLLTAVSKFLCPACQSKVADALGIHHGLHIEASEGLDS